MSWAGMDDMVRMENGRMYSSGNQQFYSPNATHQIIIPARPTEPEPENIFTRKNMILANWQNPRWLNPRYAYLSFVPVAPFFEDGFCIPLSRRFRFEEDLAVNDED